MDYIHTNDNNNQVTTEPLVFHSFYINLVDDENNINEDTVFNYYQQNTNKDDGFNVLIKEEPVDEPIYFPIEKEHEDASNINSSTEEEQITEKKRIFRARSVVDFWPEEVLSLKTREINMYIKNNKLTDTDIISLKKNRRRRLNRMYARRSRENKTKIYEDDC
jgi:hypothetical protein